MSRNEIDALIEENNAELEALRREMAERQRRDKSAETLAWAKARNAERAEAERAQATDEITTAAKSGTAMTDSTQVWETWVKARIKASREASETSMIGAVADLLTEERKTRQKLEAEHSVTRQELAALKNEVAELRGELKTRAALAEMEARLMRMEATPTSARLKTVS